MGGDPIADSPARRTRWRLFVLLLMFLVWSVAFLCTMSAPSPVGLPLALKCLVDPSEAKSHAVVYFYYSPYAALIIAIIYYSARVLPFAILYFGVRLFGDWRSELVSARWGVALLIAAAIPCLLVLFGQMPSINYGGMRDVAGFPGVDWFAILTH